MKILVACEESQRVCIAFREKGHEAFSCDIQKCSGGHPEWHILGDVVPIINGNAAFVTQDDKIHEISGKWDILIAHPPCTYLSNVGAPSLYKNGVINKERLKLGYEAKNFFMKFVNADCDKICVENPMPLSIFKLPKPDCIVQPYEFGEPYSKRTYLWLKNLPPLFATLICVNHISWHKSHSIKKIRSLTFKGIAEAMAAQWG